MKRLAFILVGLVAVAAITLVRSYRYEVSEKEFVSVQFASRTDALAFVGGCGIAKADWNDAANMLVMPPTNPLAARQCVADRDVTRHRKALPHFVYATLRGDGF